MLSQFPSSTSLLFHPTLPPSQPRPPRPPRPQCLAMATLISFKLLQKKRKKEKKENTTKTSHHLPWKTQAHLYIALMLVSSPRGDGVACPPTLQPLPALPSTRSTPSRIQGGNEGRGLMPVPNKKRQQTESGSAPSVWLQQAAGLACNMGGLLLNPGPRGPCPERGVQCVLM